MTTATVPTGWTSVLDVVRTEIKPQQFETWFVNLRCVEFGANLVQIGTPNEFYREWMDSHYRTVVSSACQRILGDSVAVEFIVTEASLEPTHHTPAESTPVETSTSSIPTLLRPQSQMETPAPPTQARHSLGDIPLNPNYLFSGFVVGPSNRLAHAASLAVTENPALSYNPLFLHGGVGLGKTHLLQAVCHQSLAQRPSFKVRYVSCEKFVNEYIDALKRGEPDTFRQLYRRVDMLLIDDIHFLSSKEALQEEFFHTFNALYNAQCQIILSSDSPPHEIPALQERLVSRFKWGLVAELEPPLYETKVVIIRRKAQARGRELPDAVVDLLANSLNSNIRELEGAVLKVIALASLQNHPVDLALCKSALRELVGPPSQIKISDIMSHVATHFHVKTADLQGKRRSKSIVKPRQLCMYLARTLTQMSLEEVGGHFGGRDHTTVLYAENKMRELIARDNNTRLLVDRLTRELQRG